MDITLTDKAVEHALSKGGTVAVDFIPPIG